MAGNWGKQTRYVAWACLFAVGLQAPGAQAKVPYLDTLLGRVVEGVLALASGSGLDAAASFRELQPTPFERARLDQALSRVKWASRNRLRYQATQRLVLIQGSADQPNAFAVGESIYVTRSLLELLNDAQVTAVVAHEVAHAERGHLLERVGNMYAGSLIHLWKTIAADWNFLTTGEIDATLAELIRSGHWAVLMQGLREAEMGQEIQADCIAWQWLKRMKTRGIATGPEQILSSIEVILGVSARSLRTEPAIAGRIGTLWSGAHDSGRCE